MKMEEILEALRICATHEEKGCGLCPQRPFVHCTEWLAGGRRENVKKEIARRGGGQEIIVQLVYRPALCETGAADDCRLAAFLKRLDDQRRSKAFRRDRR